MSKPQHRISKQQDWATSSHPLGDRAGATSSRGRQRLLLVLVGLVLVAGLTAFFDLPRREDPEVTVRRGRITTHHRGASAERVEALVTGPIERALGDIAEIESTSSVSRPGLSLVQLELAREVTDCDPVWARVRDRLAALQAELPADAGTPRLDDRGHGAVSLVVGVTWQSEQPISIAVLRRLALQLEDRVRAIDGTERVERYGDPAEEIRIEVSADSAAALGVTPRQIAERVRRVDAKTGAGSLRTDARELPLGVDGELTTVAAVRDIPIARGADGRVLRVGDVARVTKGATSPSSEIAILGGDRGIALGISMSSGHRVDRWAERQRAELHDFAAGLPGGVGLEILFDQSVYARQRLAHLGSSALFGAGLVVLVLLVLLGWRAAVVVGVALPVCGLMVMAGLWLGGIPLHQISVAGLVLSLGLLIDNAIVVVDACRSRLRAGLAAPVAAAESVRHLFAPLCGSTATTVLAFAPIALLPGGVGEFVSSIAISVTLALASSLLVALTLIPALTAWLSHVSQSLENRRQLRWLDGLGSGRLLGGYRRALALALRHPWLTVATVCVVPLAGFARGGELAEQFFPASDRDQIAIELRMPAGTPIARTARAARDAGRIVEADEDVVASHWFVGTSAPRIYYSWVGVQDGVASIAEAFVCVRRSVATAPLVRRVQARLGRALPEAEVVVRQLTQGPRVVAPIELHFHGDDLDQLAEVSARARAILATVPGVTTTRSSTRVAGARVRVRIHDEEMRRGALDNLGLAGELSASLDGALGGSVLEGTEELPVRVQLAAEDQHDTTSLRSMAVPRRDAGGAPKGWLPFATFGEIELEPRVGSIHHRDGERVDSVQAFVTAGQLPATVLRACRERLATGIAVPPGVRLELGGEDTARSEATADLFAPVGLIAALLVAILVLAVGSFRLAALVLTVGGLAIGHGLFSLWVFGYPFGFMAILGTMGLVGIAINDAIVVLAAIRADAPARSGDPDAIRDVVADATRHVLATTITTAAGFAPLILAEGGFWPPLAIAIAGGVGGATLLSLTLVPAGYLVLMRSRALGAPAGTDPHRGCPAELVALQP
ncbi:MAG: efflux RND transporter permease subunit [Planctomycetota bacterium]